MIIDMDSWEAGYADGHLGRASHCPLDFDPVSYLSGYYDARAYLVGMRSKPARRRSADGPRTLRLVRSSRADLSA
jgi:hypothetical protein